MALILIGSMIGIWSEFLSKIWSMIGSQNLFFLKIGIGAFSEKTWSCPTLRLLQVTVWKREWVLSATRPELNVCYGKVETDNGANQHPTYYLQKDIFQNQRNGRKEPIKGNDGLLLSQRTAQVQDHVFRVLSSLSFVVLASSHVVVD